MSVKIKIRNPEDTQKLVDAFRTYMGITIQKVHMEMNDKSIDVNYGPPESPKSFNPEEQLYPGGRPA